MNRTNHIPGKAVCVPGSPPVDISAFLPLVDHSRFQVLRDRTQLGINSLVFPGAGHTRFEHSLGVLGLTQRMCRLYEISGEEKRHLCAYALLHDIGHGPFSHQIEPVAGGDHNAQALCYLEELHDPLVKCDLSPDTMRSFFEGSNPWHRFVSDRNLGTDKLDYLMRDALHIGFGGTPATEQVVFYSTYDTEEGIWKVEEKFLEDIKGVQKFYSYLHQHGYLNKTALSVQRLFQRAVEEKLLSSNEPPENLWAMTDYQIRKWLESGNGLVNDLLRRLFTRDFHRSCYVIKPKGYGYVERAANKPIVVQEWSRDRIRAFSRRFAESHALRTLENDVAEKLDMRPGEILFAAMPYFDKLVPKDVKIFSAKGGNKYWLFQHDREHYDSLEGDYLRTFAIRVIAPPEKREYVSTHSGVISEYLHSLFA